MVVLSAVLMMASAVRAQEDCSGGVFYVSAAVVGASAIYDIATASKSARHYNETHLSVTPFVNPRGGGGSYGVMASWSFGRARRAPVPAPKSPSTAFQLSLFSTLVPMGAGALALASSSGESEAGAFVFLGGLVVGPSVGHFYAGQAGRGIGTTLLRGAGTVIGIASIVPCFD